MSINMYSENKDDLIASLWVGTNATNMELNFMSVLIYFSHSKDFNMAKSEWISITKYSSIPNAFCICSHKLEHAFFITNKINGNILRVGQECINKFLSGEMGTQANEVQRRLKSTEDPTKRRWCGGCKRNNILPTDPQTNTVCKKCWKKGTRPNMLEESQSDKLFNRPCMGCGKYVIGKTEPEWKKNCPSCYKALNPSSFEKPSYPSFEKPSYPSFEKPSFEKPSYPSFEKPSFPSFEKPSYPSFEKPLYPIWDDPFTKEPPHILKCTMCSNELFTPDEIKRKTLCGPCFRKGESYKQCGRCYKHNIEPDSWRKWCDTCLNVPSIDDFLSK